MSNDDKRIPNTGSTTRRGIMNEEKKPKPIAERPAKPLKEK